MRHSEGGSTLLDATKYEELLELILNALQVCAKIALQAPHPVLYMICVNCTNTLY